MQTPVQSSVVILLELCRLRGTNVDGVKAEMVALSGGEALLSSSGDSPDSESRKEMENWNLKNIFTTESIRWRVICVIVMHVGNQMSGINAVSAKIEMRSLKTPLFKSIR